MDLQSILRTIQPFLALFVALFVAFLTATWISAVIWAFRDIRARTRDVFAQILATLLVLIFFPLFPVPGLVLYGILRPRETLAEAYERTLEEEALLHGIEERLACPGCNRRIQEDYLFCPTCHTRLRKACACCERLLHLSWSICPYCGAAQAASQTAPATVMVLPAERATESPRLAGAIPYSLSEPDALAEAEAEPASEAEETTEPGTGAEENTEPWTEVEATVGPSARTGGSAESETGAEENAEPSSEAVGDAESGSEAGADPERDVETPGV